jgi:putative transposase
MASIEKVILTDQEKHELLIWSRSQKLDHRYVLRSKIILMAADGWKNKSIISELKITAPVVIKWKKRFIEKRMNGLKDSKRSGKPCIYTEKDKARVIHLACTKPTDGYTNHSQRRIAAKIGMSQTKVQNILSEHQLKPHKVHYWFGKSTDPEFEKKMLDVVGLYMNPPKNAIVLSVDEKTQIQALDRTQPELPLRVGNPKRLTATYKRNGTVSLVAALAVHQGNIIAETIEKNDAKTFLKFLKKLYRLHPNKHLHIIADNLSVHKDKDVKKWIESKKRLTMHHTPTYSSWLNQVEIWFNILTKDVLKGGVWHSKQQLVEQLMEYIITYNNTRANPFNWTYEGKSKRT